MKERSLNIKENIANLFLPKCGNCNTPVKISDEVSFLKQVGESGTRGSKTIFLDENKALIIKTTVPYKINWALRSEYNMAQMGTNEIEESVYCLTCYPADIKEQYEK